MANHLAWQHRAPWMQMMGQAWLGRFLSERLVPKTCHAQSMNLGSQTLTLPCDYCHAGLLTSTRLSGQQWDAPNGWAPLQHMVVEGLACSGTAQGRELADTIASRWLSTNLAAWNATGHMHEKYNMLEPGKVGGGGEYAPQLGFGWTNGVVLDFLVQGYGVGRH